MSVSETATHIDELGWLLSFFVAGVVYWGVCRIWPTRNQRLVREMGLGWEEMSWREGGVVEGIELEGGSINAVDEGLGRDEAKSGKAATKVVVDEVGSEASASSVNERKMR